MAARCPHGRLPPALRTAALDRALLPDGPLASPDWPGSSFLVWAEDTPDSSWEGTSDAAPAPARAPAPEEPLHSHGDALRTLPRDRLDPKTLDLGCPCAEGRALLGLPCGSHPPSDRWTLH
ncbi:hypothetical protein HJG60_007744 [Phyllostomus discolor]|uniref:Uncharacterized protein n=1 Tax=Phyllostomus discolor TaxID=89673 RepID=A0A834EV23_9CHIR|nr:hypothetical protein HJG60_007744 [Phyllostomus discolor]